MNTTTNNNVGSAILALSGMIARSWGKTASHKQIACRIALEKNDVLRPIADRVKTHKALTPAAYKHFKGLAKTDKGAANVVRLASELEARAKQIVAYKAQPAA